MLVVALIVFVGVFIQTVSGFGLGLVTMPFLATMIGLDVARPLMVLVAISAQSVVIFRTRHSLSLGTVGMLSLLGFVGIPVGNWIAEAQVVPEPVLLGGLAVLITGYAAYALLSLSVPELHNDRYGGLVGLLSGILTGAYNVGGPPVVIYADARRWTPDATRSNLQGFFLLKGVVLVIVHALSQNFTPVVFTSYVWTIPAIVAGLVAGFTMYKWVNAALFRRVVLVLLLLTGLNMLYGVLF